MAPIVGMNVATHVAWELTSSAGAPVDRLSVDDEILQAVGRSERITLRGRSVAYAIDVPEALLPVKPNNAIVEHFRRSADRRFMVQVTASPQPEDLSNFAQARLLANRGAPIVDTQLKTVRSVEHAGAQWIETVLVARLANGLEVEETARATSSATGTVSVTITRVVSPNSDAIYVPLARRVWDSFRFEPVSTGSPPI
jgi:hypothetical protein